MEDERIVMMYLLRDEEAITRTAEKYGSRLRALSHRITADWQCAEECENDTYLEAWRRIPPNEPREYFYAFLACITRHLSLDCCRSRERLKRSGYITELNDELSAALPDAEDTESRLDAKLLGEAISRYLSTISAEKRSIFVLRYFYLESISEISSRLSLRESKVKTTLFRIRRDLRAYLMKEGYTL